MLRALLLCLLLIPRLVFAQSFSTETNQGNSSAFAGYYTGKITQITNQEEFNFGDASQTVQTMTVIIESGEKKGQEIETQFRTPFRSGTPLLLKNGDRIILGEVNTPEETFYEVIDRYRKPGLIWLITAFVILVLVIGRLQGLRALGGLAASGAVLVYILLPQLALGTNPLTLTLFAAAIISACMLYIAHGFNRNTHISLLAMVITLCLAIGFSFISVHIIAITGLGTDTTMLQLSGLGNLPLTGLLLAGIILGALGVLDDVTTTQTASIAEIIHHNPKVSVKELIASGMRIGRQHITALVNTLFLAYAGTSLPLLLFISHSHEPLWVVLNSEPLAIELVRTLTGSTALILAVPITTVLASHFYTSKKRV